MPLLPPYPAGYRPTCNKCKCKCRCISPKVPLKLPKGGSGASGPPPQKIEVYIIPATKAAKKL